MKQNLYRGSLILMLTLFYTVACKKTIETPIQATVPVPAPVPVDSAQHDTSLAVADVPYPAIPSQECNFAPDYGDSIVYPQPPATSDYYIHPINNQGLSGTYLSWPGGLNMDSKTGVINLTRSETGLRYSVAFVKNGTTDTCLSQLIVAGAAYMDSVYVLALSDTTAKPYFNANPFGPPVCQGNQGQGCQFDYNNYAHNQGIEIDQKTGFIDLRKTMQNSLFGLLPINGTSVLTTIYYKLNDNSNYAPQKIQLKMVYYNRKSDIPAGLLASVTNKLLNTLSNFLITKDPSTRPPIIIIVRNN
jgi:hypothetical protein